MKNNKNNMEKCVKQIIHKFSTQGIDTRYDKERNVIITSTNQMIIPVIAEANPKRDTVVKFYSEGRGFNIRYFYNGVGHVNPDFDNLNITIHEVVEAYDFLTILDDVTKDFDVTKYIVTLDDIKKNMLTCSTCYKIATQFDNKDYLTIEELRKILKK